MSAEVRDPLGYFLERLEAVVSDLARQIVSTAQEAGSSGDALRRFGHWALSGEGHAYAVVIAGSLAAIICLGFALEYALRHAAGPTAEQSAPAPPTKAHPSALSLLQSFALHALSILICQAAAALAFFAIYQLHQPARRLVLTYVAALAVVRIVAAATSLLFAWNAQGRRLLDVSSGGLARLRHETVLATTFASFGFATAALLRLSGASNGAVNFLLLIPYVAFFATVTSMLFTVSAYADSGKLPSDNRRRPVLSLIFVLLVFVAGQVAIHLGHHGIVLAVIGSLLLGVIIHFLDVWLTRPSVDRAGTGALVPAPAITDRPRRPRLITKFAIHFGGTLALLWIWGADPVGVLEGIFGPEVAQAVFKVVLTTMLALLAWEILEASIGRLAVSNGEGTTQHPADPELGGIGSSRLATLIPLFRKAALAFITLLAGMTVLSAMGIDVAPLLAGAGVAGIAIGFGAQTLVQDVVSGAFFLIDDAFRMGEYIEIGQDRGRVEHISIRSLRLRHHRGPLVTIPFGEIKTLTNHSRDWAIVKLQFRFAFGTDPAKVKKVVKRVSAELMDHPEYGAKFLEPLKSQGVRGMDESGVVIGVKFMARPGEQFQLRREAYQRLLAQFDLAGVALARPQVVVQMPGDDVPAAAAKAGAAAALGALQQDPQEKPAA